MTAQELATAARYGLAVVALVHTNRIRANKELQRLAHEDAISTRPQ